MDQNSHALLIEHIQNDFMYYDNTIGDDFIDNIYYKQLNTMRPFVQTNPALGKFPKKKVQLIPWKSPPPLNNI